MSIVNANIDKKKKSKKRLNTVTKILAVIYLIALMIFEISLIVLDVLPTKTLAAAMLILGVLSIILFVQLFFGRIKKPAKIFASVLSTVMIIIFCFGTVYSMTTVDFLNKVSVQKKNNVDSAFLKKPFVVCISGKDKYGDIGQKSRSDVNMVVVVNPKKHKILMVSIPRDYEINLTDRDNAKDKLTHTGIYGIETTISSIEDLLDIKTDYYLQVNFSTVVKLIDAIGGVTVDSDHDFYARKRNECEAMTDTYHYVVGPNNLNGDQALAFARERHAFQDGDNQRIKDQQKVMEAVVKKFASSKTLLSKYPNILNSIENYMRTSMSGAEIRALIKMQLKDMPKWTMEAVSITGHDSHQSTYTGGSQLLYVMAPDEESIRLAGEKIKEVMEAGYKKEGEEDDNGNKTGN